MGKQSDNNGLTLIELLISICIFTIILMAFANINIFTRYQVLSTDRRVKIQNEASYVLEHMSKNIIGTDTWGGAVGTFASSPIRVFSVSATNNGIAITVDNLTYSGTDKEIAYTYDSSTYRMFYYPDASNTSVYTALTDINQATGISYVRGDFTTTTTNPTYYSYDSSNNYIEVQITTCWNPSLSTCGTADNPSVKMKNRIYMPSVSTH